MELTESAYGLIEQSNPGRAIVPASSQPGDIKAADTSVASTGTPNAADSDTAPLDAAVEANAWQEHSLALAKWARLWLANREDTFGAYLPLYRRTKRGKTYTAKRTLTLDILATHFRGDDVGDLVGLHAISPDDTSGWVAFDLDLHGQLDPNLAARNLTVAVGLFEIVRNLGYAPLLLDSDGRGGYHLWVIFEPQLDSELAYGFGQWLADRAQQLGIDVRPESFPKQPRLTEKRRYGNWLRLPGRHHTCAHWTEVWTGSRWASGEEAIAIILGTVGRSPIDLPISTVEKTTVTNDASRAFTPGQHEDVRRPITRILHRLRGVVETGIGWVALCPAHNDTDPSLSVGVGERGKALLYCHAGCAIEKIVEKIGLTMEDLFPRLPCGRREALKNPIPSTTHAILPDMTVGTAMVPPPSTVEVANNSIGSVGETLSPYVWSSDTQPAVRATDSVDWEPLMAAYESALRPENLDELARSLGLPVAVFRDFRVGWNGFDQHGPCWAIAEVDAAGRVVGIQRRYPDSSKRAMHGGRRGLIVPRGWSWRSASPIFLPEGFTDTATLTSEGKAAIGRPSVKGGIEMLAGLLANVQLPIIVVGDNDEKDGQWPGREGAIETAAKLTRLLRREVKWAMPPHGFKDVREFATRGSRDVGQ